MCFLVQGNNDQGKTCIAKLIKFKLFPTYDNSKFIGATNMGMTSTERAKCSLSGNINIGGNNVYQSFVITV